MKATFEQIIKATSKVTGVRANHIMGDTLSLEARKARVVYLRLTEAEGCDAKEARRFIRKNRIGWSKIEEDNHVNENNGYLAGLVDKASLRLREIVENELKPMKVKDESVYWVLDISSRYFGEAYLVLNNDLPICPASTREEAVRISRTLASRKNLI